MTRRYDMSRRSAQAVRTRESIISATEKLLRSTRIEEVSLQAIAEEAGTTMQTVLRHMESRDGCFVAVSEVVAARVEKQRGRSAYDSRDEAVADLVAHYEAEGRLMLNLLAQERKEDAFITAMLRKGRTYHREWVQRCLISQQGRRSVTDIDALVLATDIYAWKLLRLDLGRSARSVVAVMSRVVNSILEAE